MNAQPHTFDGQARRALFMLYAGAQFLVLTVLAMLVYPGGAVFEPQSDHYLFFRNFFSDLGATRTPSGRPNLASHILFVVALGCVGVALAFFSGAAEAIVKRRSRAGLAGKGSRWAAVIAGLGFIGIAATPWNHVLDAHNAFVQAAFGFLLIYVLCLLVVQLQNKWPAAYTGLNCLYLLLLLAYVVILFAGPTLQTPSGLEFQVAAQKIIVYASIANLSGQAFAIWHEAQQR